VIFRRWDVVSVPFPFIERYATKRRPALVDSTDAFHRAHGACFGAMITTARNMQDLRPDDIEVADLVKAGLPRACASGWRGSPRSNGTIASAGSEPWPNASGRRSVHCSDGGSASEV
jgi:hypothetical protein